MSARPLLLLKEFLTTIGMDFGDQLEKERSVLIELESGLILTFWVKESSIIVVAPLATVSKEKEKEVYADCLSENFAAFPEMNRFFSLDPDSRELVLMASWGVAETQFETFLKHMTDFAELASKWYAKLVLNATAPMHKEEAPAAPEESTPSAHDMMMFKA